MDTTQPKSGDSPEGLNKDTYNASVNHYQGFHDAEPGGGVDVRKQGYMSYVNSYYDLVTDFYEFAWGTSFHFARQGRGETFQAAIARHEHILAARMGLRSGMKVLDLGCGVGGPMREIARFSGATIIGINNNAYQIEKGRKYNEKEGLESLCSFTKADFLNLPFEDGSIDAIYFIEASCHAPDRLALFTEAARVLKPGGVLGSYEWCTTDRYNPEDAKHREIKRLIEEGDALPDMISTDVAVSALEEAGFEIMEQEDLALDPTLLPWYHPLTGQDRNLRSIPRTPVGRTLTNVATRVMEFTRIAPRGTVQVSDLLNRTADALVAGGKTGIFTPMFLLVGRKL